MKFDRSQFKPTTVDDLQQQDQQTAQATGTNKSDRPGFVQLKKDGSKNVLRIFPKHPGTKSFMYPYSVHKMWTVKKDDKGNPVMENGEPKKELRNVYSAKVHRKIEGGGVPLCIIDEYIQRVYKRAYEEIQDDDLRKIFLRPITGWGSGSNFRGGIKMQTRYVCYGNLNSEFGRVELPIMVKDSLNTIANQQDNGNGSITVDPFTDPETGLQVFITYYANEKDPKKKYQVAPNLSGGTPLSDADFAALSEATPLEQLYTDVYKADTFQLALDALQLFEQLSRDTILSFKDSTGAPYFPDFAGYNIFSDESFLDTCEQIAESFPEEEGEGSTTSTAPERGILESDPLPEEDTKPSKKRVRAQDTKTYEMPDISDIKVPVFDPSKIDTSGLDQMNILQLGQFIQDNSLAITPLPNDTADTLRQTIKDEVMLLQAQQKEQTQQGTGSDDIAQLMGDV